MEHTFARMFFGERTRVLMIGDDPAGLASFERCSDQEAFEVKGVVGARKLSECRFVSEAGGCFTGPEARLASSFSTAWLILGKLTVLC